LKSQANSLPKTSIKQGKTRFKKLLKGIRGKISILYGWFAFTRFSRGLYRYQ
jgi:hypothetical protein